MLEDRWPNQKDRKYGVKRKKGDDRIRRDDGVGPRGPGHVGMVKLRLVEEFQPVLR